MNSDLNRRAADAGADPRKVDLNPLEPQPRDSDIINVNVEADIDYWSRALGVSRARLARAIEAVGPEVGAVRRFLAA